MALHELSTETEGPYEFYPTEVFWEQELLGFDLNDEPVWGGFWQVRWVLPIMRTAENWGLFPSENLYPGSSLYPYTGGTGFRILQYLMALGEPLVLKTIREDRSSSRNIFGDVYIAELTGYEADLKAYDVEVVFTRIQLWKEAFQIDAFQQGAFQ